MKKLILTALTISLFACSKEDNVQETPQPTAPNYTTVTTFAGNTQGFADGTGTAAQFNYPYGIALDASGNAYIADTGNNRIRKITPAGVVSIFVGTTQGYLDGTGTNAQFREPTSIAVDATGNIFVADTYNNRIRKVTPSGDVTTIAGSSNGYTDGTGSAAKFNYPFGITLDNSGNIYVADTGNHKIRKITSAGVVTTIAGSTEGFEDGAGNVAKFKQPYGLVIDNSGNIYVTDSFNYKVRKITSSGVVSTIAGSTNGSLDGTGSSAKFEIPKGITKDGFGNLYVTEFSKIRKITPTGVVSTVTGSTNGFADGSVSSAQFSTSSGIAIDANGNIYVADTFNHKIRKIAP